MFLSLNIGEQNYKNYKIDFLITVSISTVLGIALIVMVVLLLCTRRHQKRHVDTTVYMEPTVPDNRNIVSTYDTMAHPGESDHYLDITLR